MFINERQAEQWPEGRRDQKMGGKALPLFFGTVNLKGSSSSEDPTWSFSFSNFLTTTSSLRGDFSFFFFPFAFLFSSIATFFFSCTKSFISGGLEEELGFALPLAFTEGIVDRNALMYPLTNCRKSLLSCWWCLWVMAAMKRCTSLSSTPLETGLRPPIVFRRQSRVNFWYCFLKKKKTQKHNW